MFLNWELNKKHFPSDLKSLHSGHWQCCLRHVPTPTAWTPEMWVWIPMSERTYAFCLCCVFLSVCPLSRKFYLIYIKYNIRKKGHPGWTGLYLITEWKCREYLSLLSQTAEHVVKSHCYNKNACEHVFVYLC